MLKLNRDNDTFDIVVDGGTFTVRPITLSKENKLKRQNTEIKRGVEQVDSTKYFRDRFDDVVRGWDDIEIAGDPNPECNRANKDWICEHFTSVAGKVLAQTEEKSQDTREAEDENLSGASSGNKKAD